jgi:hypothetical protein
MDPLKGKSPTHRGAASHLLSPQNGAQLLSAASEGGGCFFSLFIFIFAILCSNLIRRGGILSNH